MSRRARHCRPLTTGDGMILLLALGIGLGWMRSIHLAYVLPWPWFDPRRDIRLPPAHLFHRAIHIARLVWPFAFALSCAVFYLGLRPPRPGPARLARQPGFVASAAVVLAGGLFALECLLGWIVRRATGIVKVGDAERFEKSLYLRPTAPGLIGLTVVASWALLVVSRRWRSEPAAIDRIGRALGLYWVVMFLVCTWFVLGIL